jgi:hypothetical protein
MQTSIKIEIGIKNSQKNPPKLSFRSVELMPELAASSH